MTGPLAKTRPEPKNRNQMTGPLAKTRPEPKNSIATSGLLTGTPIISLEEETEYVNLLAYGDSGCGKTVLGGSDDKVIFAAPENRGTLSAKRRGSTAYKWPILAWADHPDGLDMVSFYNKMYDLSETKEGIPFNWIVLDTLGELRELAVKYLLLNADPDNSEYVDAEVEGGHMTTDELGKVLVWTDHQVLHTMLYRIVDAFNELPVNVLYTAHAVTAVDTEGNDFVTPDIPGKGYQLSQKIASKMTSYGYMQVKRRKNEDGKVEKFRRITWETAGPIRGKDRTEVLAPYTDNPTLKGIRTALEGYKPQVGTPKKRTTTRTPKAED